MQEPLALSDDNDFDNFISWEVKWLLALFIVRRQRFIWNQVNDRENSY